MRYFYVENNHGSIGTIKTELNINTKEEIQTFINNDENLRWVVGEIFSFRQITEAHYIVYEEIQDVFGDLSPENISMDGEASRSYVNSRYNQLIKKLVNLYSSLGQHITKQKAAEIASHNV